VSDCLGISLVLLQRLIGRCAVGRDAGRTLEKSPTITNLVVSLTKRASVENRTHGLSDLAFLEQRVAIVILLRRAGVENRRTEPLRSRGHASEACDDQ
jgi:hypothetical protein